MLVAARRIQLTAQQTLEAGQVVNPDTWSALRTRTQRVLLANKWVREEADRPTPQKRSR